MAEDGRPPDDHGAGAQEEKVKVIYLGSEFFRGGLGPFAGFIAKITLTPTDQIRTMRSAMNVLYKAVDSIPLHNK
jgi:hypothetical protein